MTDWATKTWFITGASTGFGKAIARTVLARGGRVVATARNPDTLADLVAEGGDRVTALKLDVTKPDEIAAALADAEAFGGIDVLVNNAGYGFLGGVEESSLEEIGAQFDVNFFGPLNIIRAALPAMRKRGSGYILNFSSISGVAGFAGAGFYAATKFALEGMSESLGGELEGFGIKVLIVEPGYFRTEFSGRSIMGTAHGHPDYAFLAKRRDAVAQIDGTQMGDPDRAGGALIAAMNAENPPRRIVLGSDAYGFVSTTLAGRVAELEQWRATTESTDFSAG